MNVEVGDRVVARTSDGIAYTGVIIEVQSVNFSLVLLWKSPSGIDGISSDLSSMLITANVFVFRQTKNDLKFLYNSTMISRFYGNDIQVHLLKIDFD